MQERKQISAPQFTLDKNSAKNEKALKAVC